ncbi:MAG: tetratricopeptide repeat protein [Chloroflexota bacterium]
MSEKTILILAANPINTQRLGLDKEVRAIKLILREIDKREKFRIEDEWAVTSADLQKLLLVYKPHIVHITGHGFGRDGIQLDDHVVASDAMADLFRWVNGVCCIVLNSCKSEATAKLIAKHIKYVVGMLKDISDEAAIRFSIGFYLALAADNEVEAQEEIEFAYRLGCNAIWLANLPEHTIPVLFTDGEVLCHTRSVRQENALVQLTLDEDYDGDDILDKAIKLLKAICKQLDIDEELLLKKIKRGSVELIIELPAYTVEPLLSLVGSGVLDEHRVIHAEPILETSDFDFPTDNVIAAEFPNLLEISSTIYDLVTDESLKESQEELQVSVGFPALFRDNIARIAQHILQELEGLGDSPISPDVRDLALHNLSYMLEHGEAWTFTRKILVILAPKMEQEGHRDDWIPLLKQGIEQSRYHHDTSTEAELHFQLGILYQLLGQFEGAGDTLRLSATGFAKMGDRRGQIKVLNRWAYVARLQRRYDEATQLLDQVEVWIEDDDPERAYSYFVQGSIAFDQRDWAEAATLFKKSLTLWQQQENLRMVAWSLTNLGAAMRRLDEYEEAIRYYEQAIDLFDQINDSLFRAVAHMNLGNVYEALKQYEMADDLYTKAEFVFREMQDELRLAMVYTNIGVIHRHMQNWSWARMSLLDAIERWQQIGNTKSFINAVMELGRLYEDQGLYPQATTKFHDALNALSDIKNEPGYGALLEEVTAHLTQVQAKTVEYQPIGERTPPP